MERNNYYTLEVFREMLPFLWERDTSFINVENQKAIRFFSVKNPYYLERINKEIVKFIDTSKFNVYRSLANYKTIPDFTYNPSLRASRTKLWTHKEEFKRGELFTGYDLFFDFDVKNPDNEKEYSLLRDEVLLLKEYLDGWKVPYYVYFSGKKGIQLVIPYKYFKSDDDSFNINSKENIFNKCKKIVENIKVSFDFQFLDLNQNGVSTRLCKCPYSLSQIDCVVLPLTDEQLETFSSPEDFHFTKVMKKIKIKNRGSLERFSNLDYNQKLRNTKQFLEYFRSVIK